MANDDIFEPWCREIGVENYSPEGKWATYNYNIGKIDIFDYEYLQKVIDRLAGEIMRS